MIVMIFGIYEDPENEATLIECYFCAFCSSSAFFSHSLQRYRYVVRFAYTGHEVVLKVSKNSKKTTIETPKQTTKEEIKKATGLLFMRLVELLTLVFTLLQ
jgi:hypothetical protein